jgi:hypothetical protein
MCFRSSVTMASAASTKSREPVYLLRKYVEEIRGLKLPSNQQVLGHFLYLHREQTMTVREASRNTVERTEEFWSRARIPVRHRQDSIKKVEALFQRWQALKKNASRRTETQQKNEEEFTDCFDDLFDIAHSDALGMLKIDEDKAFLLSQRQKGRIGAMSSVDTVLSRKEEKRYEKVSKEQERLERSISKAENLDKEVAMLEDSSSTSDDDDDSYSCKGAGNTLESSPVSPPAKRGRRAVITPELAAALDRHKVSSRSTVMVVGEAAKSLGQDVSSLTLNKSSIQRQREQFRTEFATSVRQNFQPNAALVVHWDGKLLADLTGRDMVDRLPILVSSCGGGSQLLSVPKLPAGTGAAQAHAVFEALNEWQIADNVEGLCFDTTSSNTGHKSGACVILEQLLGRGLLHFACRHHIIELIAGSAFAAVMGASSAPDVLIFKRFQGKWQFVNQAEFEDSSTNQLTADAVADVKEDLGTFLTLALAKDQTRDDYRELLEITLIFLGITPPRGIRFVAPGAMHQARWMSKIIYTFKIWMFRKQFSLTAREEKGLRELCIFFARVYVKAWYTAPLPTAVPNNDLQLLKSLLAYSSVNAAISKAASRKLADHLWYLSQKLVGLALFDSSVCCEIKDKMVTAMDKVDGENDPPKRVKLNEVSSAEVENKSVADFVTKNTKSVFTKLRLPQTFLQLPASQWAENRDYQAAAAIAHTVAVVNDHAERGVALIQQFSGSLTKNEEQLQFLLQVVSENRKRYPQPLKRALVGTTEAEATSSTPDTSCSSVAV